MSILDFISHQNQQGKQIYCSYTVKFSPVVILLSIGSLIPVHPVCISMQTKWLRTTCGVDLMHFWPTEKTQVSVQRPWEDLVCWTACMQWERTQLSLVNKGIRWRFTFPFSKMYILFYLDLLETEVFPHSSSVLIWTYSLTYLSTIEYTVRLESSCFCLPVTDIQNKVAPCSFCQPATFLY